MPIAGARSGLFIGRSEVFEGGTDVDKRILIVDDDASTAFFLGENLTELGPGFLVETAGSGEEAQGKMTNQRFDLVIADLRMPDMDGLDLTAWIQATYPQTRVILMTAYGSPLVEAEAGRLGICHYLTKPFRVERLIEAVREVLNGVGS